MPNTNPPRLIDLPARPSRAAVKALLDDRWQRYEKPEFIAEDPIAIPRSMHAKEDQEIAGFLVATIAWGNRRSILTNAHSLVERMDGRPHSFITSASDAELRRLEGFVHRTFNDTDLLYFTAALKRIYTVHGGLESVFSDGFRMDGTASAAIAHFNDVFFGAEHPERTRKHVADPRKGSSAKRINMFLRWMARPSDKGVDLGIWTRIPTARLELPLDVHTGNVARRLGLLTRKQNDRKAVEEVMAHLRKFDPIDPVKYDFALFGIGVYEKLL
jgi:uncharacterized protein (TIGR02757 family)